MKVYLYLWITLLIPVFVSAKEKIKVACVGNSVTYGYLLPEREKNAYPAQLQKLLGENYIVKNFGKSGATLLKMGHRPYTDQPEYQQALDFAADRVVIHLGLNDTDPRNWPHYRDNFIKDYTELIASFKAANPQCKIWICRLTPIGDRHPRFRSGTRDWHAEIQKEIEKIAVHTEVGLIDLEEPLCIRIRIGGSPCESWIDRRTLEYDLPDILQDWKHNDMIQDWVRQRAGQNIRQANRKEQRHPYEPCYLFKAGILPLEHYPIAGIIWYQGESNAHHTELAEQLFPMLVNSWRHYWQSPRLPFYYVQLSSLNRPSWPRFRDSQRRMLQTIPYTGMAVFSDWGDSLDVHPRYKKEIGERLGRWALANNYGKSITPSGPLFRSVHFHNKQAILEFDYGHHLKTSDGQALRCFEIAGPDGLFYPAKAFIEDDRVIVTSPKVTAPCAVRYAWQPFTRANLVNGDNLPASTFRTDL